MNLPCKWFNTFLSLNMNLIFKSFLVKKQIFFFLPKSYHLPTVLCLKRELCSGLHFCSFIVFLGTMEDVVVQRHLTVMHSLVYLTFGFCGLSVTPLSPTLTPSLCSDHHAYLCFGESVAATLNYLLPSLLKLLGDSELILPITSLKHMLSAALIVDASCWTLHTLKISWVIP